MSSERLRVSVCLKEPPGEGHPDNQLVFSRLILLDQTAVCPYEGPPQAFSVLLGMDFIRHRILHIEDRL